MRLQWFALPLLLVLVPTAILSFMAAQALRHRDDVRRERLAEDAAETVASACEAVQAMLDDESHYLAARMVPLLEDGNVAGEMARLAAEVTAARDLVAGVYLFMDPWGMVWPSGEAGELVDALRARTARASNLRDPVAFTRGGAAYCFRALPGRLGLMAGYRLDEARLVRRLDEVLARHGDRQLVVTLREGPLAAHLVRGVEARDTLNQPGAVRVWDAAPAEILAEAPLPAPLDASVVAAVLRSPEALERSVELERRFFGWGLALLVTGIVGGVAVFLYGATVQIQQARQRGEFLVGVSHDLRTPLASMRMLAETLEAGRVRDEQKPVFLRTIVSESDRLARLIERVLYLVRFGQGSLAYHRRRVDIAGLVRRAVDAMQSPGHVLTYRAAEHVPNVLGDEPALMQVVTNLLDNAVKYGTEPGTGKGTAGGAAQGATPPAGPGVEVTVDVGTRRRGAGRAKRVVVIAVRDFGMGIAWRERRRIFRRFYRSARARDRHVSGVGLGLALCRTVVRAHGGRIEVQSRVGEGTTFRVVLPAVDAGDGRDAAGAAAGRP